MKNELNAAGVVWSGGEQRAGSYKIINEDESEIIRAVGRLIGDNESVFRIG